MIERGICLKIKLNICVEFFVKVEMSLLKGMTEA